MDRWPDRRLGTGYDRELVVWVEPERAGFSAWYEMFPRSTGPTGTHGTFATTERRLPYVAGMGFDVLYLPPIHPIGRTHRKGPNNDPAGGPDAIGSPWAIGSEEGGHTAIDPALGTFEDFDHLLRAAREHGLDLALDVAFQCSPDHPWVREHPEWFRHRADGSIQYAENPPKKYEDIYPLDFETEDWRALWAALRDVFRFWIDRGVSIFRVDNPHTKAFAFWEWCIRDLQRTDPDVIFFSEAFTRPKRMKYLAKLGFTQSYTYFTWKNSRWELSEYVSELAYSGEQEYFRPNFFANTPDILHAYLQHGGPAAFEARLVLAATLSPSYGIYSGYEHFENTPAHEGSEEYLDSEKYELKKRSLDGPLLPMIQRLNAIRRDNPALQELSNVTFLDTANDALIAYAKHSRGNTVITVVNIDPHQGQEGVAVVPAHLGLPPSFTAHDLLSDERYQWRIGPNYVHLVPGERQAHLVVVET
jgi:starch synthase (maltosyl-transferring)